MAITYHAGRRIQATQADFDGTPAVSGGWKEIGRASNSSLPDVTSLTDKRYLMFLNFQESNASRPVPAIRVNGDSGSNYARRGNSGDGTGDYTNITQTQMAFGGQPQGDTTTVPYFTVGYIANKSDKEKLGICHNALSYQLGAGSSEPLERRETVFKWANTSEAVDQLSIVNHLASGSFNTNGELVVLGYDPDDTHTTNFWEQLADVNATGSQSSFDTGTITAKKYLWIQFYWKATFTGAYTTMRVGNTTLDTGSNYAWKWSNNGGTDSTGVSKSDGWYPVTGQGSDSATDYYVFGNMFILNNASKEKLGICHTNRWDGAGAGNANARSEVAVKWANTTNQIDIVGLERAGGGSSGNFDSESFIKVWGSD